MSTEEDLELRDLVTQALETNGVLSKIRAELRASVFLALEEQDLLQTETSYANKTFKKFIKTSEGMLLTQLVREFLEFFELDFTLSVFDPETSYGKDYEYLGRNTLIKELGMKNVNADNGPLLAEIFKITSRRSIKENKDTSSTNEEDKGDVRSMIPNDDTIILKKNVKNSQIKVHTEVPNKESGDQNMPEANFISGRKYENIEIHVQPGEGNICEEETENGTGTAKQVKEESKKKESAFSSTQREETASDNPNDLMSLSNLPPLLTNKSKSETQAQVSSSKREINQLKTMINSLDVGENNYDEDFQSSASGSGVDGRSGKNSLPGSESEEIEEDINSGIDDLLSNASGLEDMTIDATVSNASGLGDYMENV